MKMAVMRKTLRSGLALGLCVQLAAPALWAQGTADEKKTAAPSKKDGDKAKADKKDADKAKADKKDGDKAGDAEGAEVDPETPPGPVPLSESLTGMARAEYEAGRILFNDGDYQGARLKFEKSYGISQDARLWWNIAAAEKNLRNYAKVITALDKYLKDGGELLTEQDREEAKRLVETVSTFVATVELSVQPAGAIVSVDNVEVGTAPIAEPLRLDQGDRVFVVRKAGFLEHKETRRLGGGDNVKLVVSLKPEPTDGRVRILAGAGDSISIDGRVVGRSSWEGALPAGVHTLSVTSPKKRPYQSEIVVQVGQTSTARIALEAEVERRDGFWAGPWPWVVGGAVLAAGAGVGAYFVFRPEDEAAPPIVDGTLGNAQAPLLRF
jgi:hypothetical protein